MDSPVRQYLKQKDYRRHKLFRKINRRRKAERLLAIDAPMKELKKRLRRFGDGKDEKKELPYPLRTSSDYDDNLAYQSGIKRDEFGHMMSTTQEEYPLERTYLKKPFHPTYGKAVWGDMAGGYLVYRKGDKDYAAPNFAELMYTKPPFRYGGGKDGKKVYLDQSIDGVNLWRDNLTGGYFYLEGNGPRIDLTPFNTLGSDDPTTWSFLDAEGKEYNPRRLHAGSEISQTTDAQRVANEVRDVLNTRTWRSDVADLLHNFGDALMWSTMAMNPEGEALMTKALEKAASLRKLAKPTFNKAALLLQLQSKRLGGDLKYGTPNLFEKYIYGRKINGLSVDPFDIAKLPYSDAINELWSKDVAIGLPADAKQSLLDETIARNVRAFEEQGVDPLAILEYRNRAAALMDDVRVGRYTNQDYIKAGKDDIGGFYDDKRNFLSVNTESGFPDGFVEKHEGRHLLDYKLDDDILMGTNAYRNNLGSDFDSDATAKAMRMAVLKQNDVLTKAYDMDFVNLPNTKYAGSLKGYPHMERETVTTNADSRRILFDKKHANNWSLELKDKLIDKVPKEDIFDAVELANGYGRRYILFLRDNGKLTEEKANLFREAMKYKGILAVPMAVGAGYGLIGGSNDITFNKGKDSGIHIKPLNRGKFTALKKRTGKTTEQLTHSKNPLTRKRAIFALNARKWHKKK